MSVINTMLKDLERRGSNDTAVEEVLRGLSSAARPDVHESSAGNYHLVGLLGVMVVVLVMAVVYLISPYQISFTSRDVSAPGVEIPARAEMAHSQIAEPVTGSVKLVEPVVVASNTVTAPVVTREAEAVAQSTPVPAPQQAVVIQKTVEKAQAVLPKVTNTPKVVENVAAAAYEEEIETEQLISKTQREPTREEKSQQAYLSALSLYNRGRIQESRTQLKDALNYDAFNLDATKLLASIYLREGQAGIALAVIDKGLTTYRNNQELLRLYLQAQVQLEHYAEAIALMEQRVRMSTPEDIAYLAGLYQKNDGHLSAVKLYSQALQLKPVKSVWWMGQGISFEALSQRDEALQSYRQSIVSGQLSAQLADYVKNRINTIEQAQTRSNS